VRFLLEVREPRLRVRIGRKGLGDERRRGGQSLPLALGASNALAALIIT
jgi:hypothetical protein